ncbi:hypothetical protein NQ315_001683 [Exocentrus adspersus]|uniref:Uncharacterized protein n=1 Tax=Exocentrus adspersus TaxID=1586481 RepID=A0AAV8WA88_9CUCU|nr:hypothetical protein NQ315_001683 [Exocentrus adspersus]
MMAWRTHSDFMEDLWCVSEIEGISARESIDRPPPPSILEYQAQVAANNTGSVYDQPVQEDDDVIYVISGRGRGGISTILRPGISSLSDNLVEEDVRRKIREVSGCRYSNKLLEEYVKNTAVSNNRNSASPVKQPSQVVTPRRTSGLSSPLETSHSGLSDIDMQSPRNSPGRPSTTSSPHPAQVEVANAPPLPLSVMRKLAQEQRMQQKKASAEPAPVMNDKKSLSPVVDKSVKRKCPKYREFQPNSDSRPSSSDGYLSWRRQDASNKFENAELEKMEA